MSKYLPYVGPEDLELPGREAYSVTQESRFDENPDAPHLPSCPCAKCTDAQRCAKCGKRGGVIDCETCRILNRAPHVRGPSPYGDDERLKDHVPIRGETYPGPLRRNGERIGDPVHPTPTCVVCGCTERVKLWKVRDQYECIHHENDRVLATRLRLVKVEQP